MRLAEIIPRWFQRTKPRSPEALLESAQEAIARGDYTKARTEYQLVLEGGAAQSAPGAHLGLGVIGLRTGDLESALDHFAIAANSGESDVREAAAVFRVQALSRTDHYDELIESCSEILERRPISTDAFREVANVVRRHLRMEDPRAPEIERRVAAVSLEFARSCAQVPELREHAREGCERIVGWSTIAEQRKAAGELLNELGPDLGPHFWNSTDAIGLCRLLWEDLQDAESRNAERYARLNKYAEWRQDCISKGKALYERVRDAEAGAPPFVLYLRSFGIEAGALGHERDPLSEALMQGGFAHPNRSTVVHVERSFEAWLAGVLEGAIDVLAIVNPREAGASTDIIPRIEVSDDAWRETVEKLIERATAIVQRACGLTPGVQFELETIAALRRLHDLLIVVDDDGGCSIAESVQGLPGASSVCPMIRLEDELMDLASLADVPVLGRAVTGSYRR